VNSYADANFLAGQLAAHVAALKSYVLGLYSNAKFELLWPRDVNQASQQLNLYVNLPSTWDASGFDRWKTEALSFGSGSNLDEALGAIQFPFTSPMSWPKNQIWYNLPVLTPNCPWQREYLLAARQGMAGIVLWAADHIRLRSEPLPLAAEERSCSVVRMGMRR
jgi:hypothetical protein